MTSSKKHSPACHNCATLLTTFTKAQKRWRVAFLAIRSIRAMLSLLDEVVSQRNPLYTALTMEMEEAPSHTTPCLNQDMLSQLVNTKDLAGLQQLGGVKGVATALETSVETGNDEAKLASRRAIFGSNMYPKSPPETFLHFVLEAFKDTTIIILIVCACLSLGFGINKHGPSQGWYEGGSIIVAVVLVVVVSAISNFRQQSQFEKLSKISTDIKIDALRNGRRQCVSIHDIVVGDVVFLKLGDQVPADGLFLDGHSLQVDESSMTGESDPVEVDPTRNPFLFSGSKVVDGAARKLVTAVGVNTVWGKMMSSIVARGAKKEKTPLQVRLEGLTSAIGKVGLGVAFLVLVVMLVRYFTGNTKNENGITEYKGKETDTGDLLNGLVGIVAAAVTIVVVAIPEGLPLAVTLTLAYSMKRMMGDNAMVRKLSACETMGSATVICTDKTGTLTLNEMQVTKFWLGNECIEGDWYKRILKDVVVLLCQGVGLNTTGSVYKDGESDSSVVEFSGSPTEKAILSWAVSKLDLDMAELKGSYEVLHLETFNSVKKRSGVSIRKVEDCSVHVHWKGAAEIVLGMCSSYREYDGDLKLLDEDGRSRLEKIIQGMAASSLRCIAFAHKKLSAEEELEINCGNNDQDKEHPTVLPEDGLTLLGIVGLEDPCRPEAKKAVEICKSAGVSVKMITGDNIFTAKAIATACGILELNRQVENGEVVEGAEFRSYTDEERMERVDQIRVMARSSPFDKLLMVQCLKKKGHVVAVTGDGTNDAPALKEADIGLSMGVQGTEVAKESSDIVILDDNFMSVATVLRWGRCVYNNIQKFIQFQLTVNVAALVINFIAAVSAGEVPLTTVQLLWVNLIMDSLGALALATERPTDELLERPPVGRTEPLITRVMWRNLLFQALYQIAVLLTFQFKGESIFKVSPEVNDTLIFNTFVLCQVFNEFNARKLEKQNVFEGIHRNHLFLGIIGITIILQVVMVEFLNKFAKTKRLNVEQWGFCILIAAVSWPIGWIVKLLPVSGKPYQCFFGRILFAFKRARRIRFKFKKDESRPLDCELG